jgi:hypothetical protein
MEDVRGAYLIPLFERRYRVSVPWTVPSRHLEIVRATTPCISESECGDKSQSGDVILPRASEGDNHRCFWRYAMVEIGEAQICRAAVDSREPSSFPLLGFVPLVPLFKHIACGHGVFGHPGRISFPFHPSQVWL